MRPIKSVKCFSGGHVWLRLLPPLAWGGLILCLSLMPLPPGASDLPGWDKLLHAAAYGLLSFFVAWALDDSRPFRLKISVAAFVITVVFGAVLELLQGAMPLGRTAEWGDLVADGVGALLGCVIFRRATMFSWFRSHLRGGEHG